MKKIETMSIKLFDYSALVLEFSEWRYLICNVQQYYFSG